MWEMRLLEQEWNGSPRWAAKAEVSWPQTCTTGQILSPLASRWCSARAKTPPLPAAALRQKGLPKKGTFHGKRKSKCSSTGKASAWANHFLVAHDDIIQKIAGNQPRWTGDCHERTHFFLIHNFLRCSYFWPHLDCNYCNHLVTDFSFQIVSPQKSLMSYRRT